MRAGKYVRSESQDSAIVAFYEYIFQKKIFSNVTRLSIKSHEFKQN